MFKFEFSPDTEQAFFLVATVAVLVVGACFLWAPACANCDPAKPGFKAAEVQR